MALYFFDMMDGHNVLDPEGRDIDGGLAQVRQEALLDAREMISEAASAGLDVTERRFEIKDAKHRLVLTVHFREALEAEKSISAGPRDNLKI